MEQNLELDARLTHARMRGVGEWFAIQQGLSPDEFVARITWLQRQPDSYVNAVVARIQELESQPKA